MRHLRALLISFHILIVSTSVHVSAQVTLPSSSDVSKRAFVGAAANLAAGDVYAPGIFVASRNPCRDQDYVPCGGRGGLFAFNQYSSEPEWKLNEISDDAPPIIKDGVLYLADSNLYAIDPRSGVVLWKTLEGYGSSHHAPVIHGQTAYFWQIKRIRALGTFGGTLLAVDIKTHRLKWSFSVKEGNVSQVEVSKDSVFFGNSGNWRDVTHGWLYVLDAKTGKLKWKVPSSGSSPFIYDSSVLTVGRDGSLQYRQLKTGKLSESFKQDRSFGEPILQNDSLIYFYKYGQAPFAFDVNSKKVTWDLKNIQLAGTPLLFNGKLYFGTEDKNLYSVHASTGKLLWKLELPHSRSSSPIIFGGQLYIVCGDGYLYQIDLRESWR